MNMRSATGAHRPRLIPRVLTHRRPQTSHYRPICISDTYEADATSGHGNAPGRADVHAAFLNGRNTLRYGKA